VIVSDVGQHQMWEAQYYHHEKPRTLITSGGLGTMGFALPAAIGAKLARPDAEVWVVAGDGGFQMTQCELATLRQEQLDIKIAVVNNGYLGMVRQWQEFFYDKRYAATPMLSPDFVALAAAYGIPGHRVTKRSEVIPTVNGVRASGGAALVEFRVEKQEAVYPMVPAGADLGAMIRRPAASEVPA
jgi:acetolactate synthase-1/2/3 large subunit